MSSLTTCDAGRRRLYNANAFLASVRARIFVFFLSFSAFGFGTFAYGGEEWNAFLDALKARGYDDVALVYLKQLQASAAAPPELNDELDYKIGAAALDAWLQASTNAERATLAEQARTAFAKYLESSPDGASSQEANAGLARLDADQGERVLADANKKGLSLETRDAKLLEARDAFSSAKPRLEAALKSAQARAKSLQGDNSSKMDDLRLAQAQFLDLLIRQATVQAQTARTFSSDAEEYKSGLTSAAKQFNKIFTTYQQYAGAFKARFLEAECRRDLGETDEALSILGELAVLPFEEQFYSLKTRSLLLFAEIVDARNDGELNMSLVKKYNDWRSGDKLPTQFYDSAEGLRIALLSGRAIVRLEKLRRTDYQSFALAGKKTFTDSDDPTYKLMNVSEKKGASGNTIVTFALKTLGSIASGRSGVALEAQALLQDEVFEGLDLSKYSFAQKVDDFQGALNAATRDAAAFSQARSDFENAAPETADDAKRAMDEAGVAAIASFRLAFDWGAKAVRPDKKGKLTSEQLSAAQTELDKLYLKYAVLCYATGRYEDAFASGDYLARRRPEFADASQGALVALRALQSTLAGARTGGASETVVASLQAKLDAYSDFVVKSYGDSSNESIAQEATLVQLNAAVSSGDVAAARECLEKIPESSPNRATAELRLGQGLWNEWNARNASFASLQAEAEETGEETDDEAGAQDVAAAKARLDELAEGARQALYDGLERMLNSSSGVSEDNYLAIYSTYLLAQLYERQGKLEDAEKWLTHPVIGALSSVERAFNAGADAEESAESNAAVRDVNFQTAVFALSLSLLTSDPDRFDEAEKTMTRLEELASRSPDNTDKLTNVYLRLGKRLEERLHELKESADQGDEAKQTELEQTTKGFETFLKRVASRDEGTGYGSLRWVADSYMALGRGLSGTLTEPPKEALAYYSEAGKTYQTILKKIDADASFAPNERARLATTLKIVECLRCAGAYQKAFEQLKKPIVDAPENLDVQTEAARIFQDWGRKETKYFLTAIVGASPDAKGKNRVWGWNGIIKRLAPSIDKGERYKELFYDAYLAKTRCRFMYVSRLKDKDEIAKQARDAEADLERLFQTRPDLGGPATFAKFDSAYKNFQKKRGERSPIGLRERAKKNGSGADKSAKK